MKRPSGFAVVFVLFFSLMFSSGLAADQKEELERVMKDFNQFYQQELDKFSIVGSAFYLLHDNQIIAREFRGMADKGREKKVDADTIFHWASITKTLTGIAIMQLRDHGLLTLDDAVIDYVPELKSVHNPFCDMKNITIRQLMNHSAGLRQSTWSMEDKEWHPFEPVLFSQISAMFPYTEVTFEPGSKWSYSNLGFTLLGRIIEVVTTDNYETYIEKNLFKPLGMTRSFFDQAPYHLREHLARGYKLMENGELKPQVFDFNTGATVANGGLNAPLEDYAKYVGFLLGDRAKQSTYDNILKRSTLEEMWEPGPVINRVEKMQILASMGLSFFILEEKGIRLVFHTGSQNGFKAYFYIHPESKTGYMVTYNTAPEKTIPRDKSPYMKIDRFVQTRVIPLFRKDH